VDSQKVGGIVQLVYEFQLIVDLGADFFRYAVGVASFCAFPGQTREFRLRCSAGWGLVIRVLVAQFVERKGAALGDDHRLHDSFRMSSEQPCHFCRWFEMALCIGHEAEPGLIDAAVFSDAGKHVHQGLAVRHMHPDVVGGNQRDVYLDRKLGEGPEPCGVVAMIAAAGGDPDIAAQDFSQAVQMGDIGGVGFPFHFPGRQGNKKLVARMGKHVFEVYFAIALGRAAAPQGDQLGQPPIGRPVGRETEQ
jgi:hypothetical protein